MSSWSEIRARSGDPLNDTLNDLISRANMNEAIKDELTAADEISPIRIMRSKVTVRDDNLMTGYVRPLGTDSRYFMPMEPDGDRLRLQVKFDSGCDTLPDYSLNENETRISFGASGLPKLLKGTEDDGITAGDFSSQLDGRTHAYRVQVSPRNSIRSMVEQGKTGFSFIYRLFFVKIDNLFRSGNTRRATLLDYIDNDQVTHALRLEVDDSGILYFYMRHNSVNYSVKTTQPVFTPPPAPDYAEADYNVSIYDTSISANNDPQPIEYTDLAFVVNFSTHQILIYRDKEPMTTTSTGVTIIPSSDPMFPPSFADPPPPPPTPVPYIQPFERVYNQFSATADVKINKVTVTELDAFYNVENGVSYTEPLLPLYNVPVGVPWVPPGDGEPPPSGDKTTPMDPMGSIPNPEDNEDYINISQSGDDDACEAAGNYVEATGTGIGSKLIGNAISKLTFYLTAIGELTGKFYFYLYDEGGIPVSQLGWGDASEITEEDISESTAEFEMSDIIVQAGYMFGVSYTEGDEDMQLLLAVDAEAPDDSVSSFVFTGSEYLVDDQFDVCCDVYGGVPGTGTDTGGTGGTGGVGPGGVQSTYGTGQVSEDYIEDFKAGSHRWDFEALGPDNFVNLELTAYLRTSTPNEDEITGIMGGGTHGEQPQCYNVGIDTITGETRYRMEDIHPDPITGEDGGTGTGLQDTFVGFRYIKINEGNGVRLEIWQDTGDNEGSTAANNWELVSSWLETEYNWQDPPADHQCSLRTDGDDDALDSIEVKWLFIREILPSDLSALNLKREQFKQKQKQQQKEQEKKQLLFSNSQNFRKKNSNRKFKKVKMNKPIKGKKQVVPTTTARIIKRTRTERRKIDRDLIKEEEKKRRRAVQLRRNCNGEQLQTVPKSNQQQKKPSSLNLILGATAPSSQSNVDLGGIDAAAGTSNNAVLQQATNQNEIVSLQVINTTSGLGNQLNTKVPTAIVMKLSGNSNPTGIATCKMWNGSGNVIATFGQVNVAEISQGGIYDTVVFENLNNTVAIVSGCRIGLEYTTGSSSDQVLVRRNPTVTDSSVIQSTNKYNGSWATNSSYQPVIHFWARGTGGHAGEPSSVPVVLPSVTNPTIVYYGGPVMSPCHVHFIFGSSDWNTQTEPFSRAELTAKIQTMFSLTSFWDGLLQYNVKRPILGNIVINTSVELEEGFEIEDVRNVVYDSIDRGLVPARSTGVWNMYVVLAPNDAVPAPPEDEFGAIHFNWYEQTPINDIYLDELFAAAIYPGDFDWYVRSISHEIVESLTCPVSYYDEEENVLVAWSSEEPGPDGEYQIGDWCEADNTIVLLNGVSVTPYFSNQDHGCVAPAGKPSWIGCPTGYGFDSATQACLLGGTGEGGISTEPPGRRGATAPNGVISCYGTGEYSEDYVEDFAASDSYRWDFEDLGSSRFAWGEELTAYLRTDNPPEDEVTGIMGGGTHGDLPKCYNVGVDTITGETRYRMEEEHPDPIDGEDGGTGVGLQSTYVGFRYIKWNQPNGVRLEIWQDLGDNEGSTPANEWELVSSWTENEYNWQDPPDDHQISLRIDGDNLDEIEVKWLGIREIKTTDTEEGTGTGGTTPGTVPDPATQYPQNPLTNLPGGSSTMGERFNKGSVVGRAITLVEFQAYRDPAVTTGTVSIAHMNPQFEVLAWLANFPVSSLPTAAPSVNTFNLVWQDPSYHIPILPADSIVVVVTNVLQGSIYVMDNVGNWDGVKNHQGVEAYKVFKNNDSGMYYQRPDIDLAGRIYTGGGDFYPYMRLDSYRQRIGVKAVKDTSSFIGKPVTKVLVTARSVNNPLVDLIYCRIRSPTGAVKATIGQIDSSIIAPATDTPLEFVDTQNEVTVELGDTVSIEYEKGTATDYIMIAINKGFINSMEGQRTMLAEATISDINTFYEWWNYDLAAIISTGGKVDLAARPMRGVRLKANSTLIGRAITEVRVNMKAGPGLFQIGSIIRCKIIRGTDKVTMCILGQYDATSLSNDYAIEYPFQNLNNYYKMVAGDMVAIEFNYGDSANYYVLLKTSVTDLFDGQNTVMFETNGRIYTDVTGVDMTGEMYIGGFMVVPDPQEPPVIPPFHYAHEWCLGAALPEDSGALTDPLEKTLKPYSHCQIILKEFRIYSIMLTPAQIENYNTNRFTITPIPYGEIEIVSHDIVPYNQ